MKQVYKLFRPLVFLQDPEKAHNRVILAGKILQSTYLTKIIRYFFNYENPKLETCVCGIYFKNPIGIAAGFDKNGVIPEFIESLGFGFEEVGSVTAHGGNGNPTPRIFRLPEDEAIINRMGLNNDGAYEINKNLMKRKSSFPIGVNIAKTHNPEILGEKAIKDFDSAYDSMNEGDYFVFNISCPNTAEGKTFEDPVALKELLSRLRYKKNKTPVFVKLSPDLEQTSLMDVLEVCESNNIYGYVISNTSSKRDRLHKTLSNKIFKTGAGGLSGIPIREKSNQIIKTVYKETKKPIIGVGGVFTENDAYDKIKLGACLVQVYTGLIYEGPGIAGKINKGLVKLLEKDGISNISKVVGIEA
jgi:dihydroorotate dehydrogenase